VSEQRTDVPAAAQVIAATRDWLEKAVLGLRLCPFAAAPYSRGQIRFRVSEARTLVDLAEDLAQELLHLAATSPEICETSLLIHPFVLNDFLDYNQFLDDADATVAALGLEGELQVASFHPAYQFAGTAPDDIENYSNRSPYPMLHLIREASVERAVAAFPGIDEIGERNQKTLRDLGSAGWQALWKRNA
jgi:hypothetical protein